MTNPLLEYDNRLRSEFPIIAGVDEVGRGTLAGPLVTAAVILPEGVDIPGVMDSKKIPKDMHQTMAEAILAVAIDVSIGVSTPEEIDSINILEADRQAMLRAVNGLSVKPDLVLIDGNQTQLIDSPLTQRTQVKGDAHSLSIAAASIIAKTVRDRMMTDAAVNYPEFGFETNAGYGTPAHKRAIEEHGVTPLHRRTFAPIKNNNYPDYGGRK